MFIQDSAIAQVNKDSEQSQLLLCLQRISTETIKGDAAPSSVVYLSDGYEAVLRHDPFEVYVREKMKNSNSHQLFDFEQLRMKNEGDD